MLCKDNEELKGKVKAQQKYQQTVPIDEQSKTNLDK